MKTVKLTSVFLTLIATFVLAAMFTCINAGAENIIIENEYDNMYSYLTDSDGNTYSIAGDLNSKKTYLVKHDRDGKKAAKTEISGLSSAINITMKEVGEKIYIYYAVGTNAGSAKGFECQVFDKSLKNKETYDLSFLPDKNTQFVDFNSSKIVYIKNRSDIYMCDMNGKNKILLLSDKEIDGRGDNDIDNTLIEYVAATDKYAAFSVKQGVGNNRYTYYYGLISLKTGKVTLKKTTSEKAPAAYGDRIVFNNIDVRITGLSKNADDKGELIIYEDGKLIRRYTEKYNESSYVSGQLDNAGKYISYEGGSNYGEHKICIRVYDKGKCINKFTVEIPHSRSYLGISKICANNGIISLSYCDKKNGKEIVKTMLIEY